MQREPGFDEGRWRDEVEEMKRRKGRRAKQRNEGTTHRQAPTSGLFIMLKHKSGDRKQASLWVGVQICGLSSGRLIRACWSQSNQPDRDRGGVRELSRKIPHQCVCVYEFTK